MKVETFCPHVLKLSRKVAKPKRATRGNVTLICCAACKKVINAGKIALMIFSLSERAGKEAIKRKLAKNHVGLALTIAKDGVSVNLLERKPKGRKRVKPWKKPDVAVKEGEELGAPWKVTKNAD